MLLFSAGVQIHSPFPITVKAAVILGTADLQGKAYVLNMTQHNGESGCVTCKETGFVVKQGKGHARCYPYRPAQAAPAKRTHQTFMESAMEAHQSRKKVNRLIISRERRLIIIFIVHIGKFYAALFCQSVESTWLLAQCNVHNTHWQCYACGFLWIEKKERWNVPTLIANYWKHL